jgi:hypothetical protein
MIDDARGAIDGLEDQLERVVVLVADLLRELHSMESGAEAEELTLEERARTAQGPDQKAAIEDALERLRALRERLRYVQDVPLSLARVRELPEDLENALRRELE